MISIWPLMLEIVLFLCCLTSVQHFRLLTTVYCLIGLKFNLRQNDFLSIYLLLSFRRTSSLPLKLFCHTGSPKVPSWVHYYSFFISFLYHSKTFPFIFMLRMFKLIYLLHLIILCDLLSDNTSSFNFQLN